MCTKVIECREQSLGTKVAQNKAGSVRMSVKTCAVFMQSEERIHVFALRCCRFTFMQSWGCIEVERVHESRSQTESCAFQNCR